MDDFENLANIIKEGMTFNEEGVFGKYFQTKNNFLSYIELNK